MPLVAGRVVKVPIQSTKLQRFCLFTFALRELSVQDLSEEIDNVETEFENRERSTLMTFLTFYGSGNSDVIKIY